MRYAASALVVLVSVAAARGEPIREVIYYQSSISADANGPLDLVAEVNFDSARLSAPIAVVMHGYSPTTGNLSNVRPAAQRLRDSGFFAVSVAMRGRDGSDGVRDSGGIEVYDILDAVEEVKDRYGDLVNGTNVHVTGYSGGGGNVMSCLTKFPDTFRVGSSFFGMSDYGFDSNDGWWFLGSSSSHRSIMTTDIGNRASGAPGVLDRYLARDSALAAINNPYSEIHLFHNYNETTCPPPNHWNYKGFALAGASKVGEFSNITVHEGGLGAYVDFNGNGVNDPNELQSWPHSFPTADAQHAAESHYLDRLLAGLIPEPVLSAADELFVAGYVVTRPFSAWVGDGQDGAIGLEFEVSGSGMWARPEVASSNPSIAIELRFQTLLPAGWSVLVVAPGAQWIEVPDALGAVSIALSDMEPTYLLPIAPGQSVLDEQSLTAILGERTDVQPGAVVQGRVRSFLEGELRSTGARTCIGDIDGDLDADVLDFSVLAASFGAAGLLAYTNGDLDGDGSVNVLDFGLLASGFGCGGSEQ